MSMEIIRIDNKGTVEQPWGIIHIDGDRTMKFWGPGSELTWTGEWPTADALGDSDTAELRQTLSDMDWSTLPAGGVLHEFDAYWNSLTEEERKNVTEEALNKMRAAIKK